MKNSLIIITIIVVAIISAQQIQKHNSDKAVALNCEDEDIFWSNANQKWECYPSPIVVRKNMPKGYLYDLPCQGRYASEVASIYLFEPEKNGCYAPTPN